MPAWRRPTRSRPPTAARRGPSGARYLREISATSSGRASSRACETFYELAAKHGIVDRRRCAGVLPAGDVVAAGDDRSVGAASSIQAIANKVSGGARVGADEALELYRTRRRRCSAGWPTTSARASIPSGSSPTSSTATSTTRTSASRAATSARSTARSDPPRATSSGSTRSSARSTRRSRSAAASCCCRAATIPICRSSGTRTCFARSRRAIRRSGCTRCRRPRSIHLSRLSRLPVPQVIERLVAAGLDSIPGGGAEILVDRVRKLLNCYGKATADEWLDVMRHAHRAGLRTTATMMYGHRRDDRGAARAPAPAARAAGRDRRLHRVHHLELSARAHRARRRRSDRRRLPAHAGDRAASCSTTSTTCRRRG